MILNVSKKGKNGDGVLWIVYFPSEEPFLSSWEVFSGAANGPAESDTCKRRCLFILCLASTQTDLFPSCVGAQSLLWVMWMSQSCVRAAGRIRSVFPDLLGGPAEGWHLFLAWGWVLWDLQEQLPVQKVGGSWWWCWHGSRGGFSVMDICTKVTEFHTLSFSSCSFMFPVAGGLGPPQGMCHLQILSSKFFTLFR